MLHPPRLNKHDFSSGFSLLEILLVLGIIAALFGAVVPSLGLNASSQMRIALRDFTSTIRASYDGAILSGRLHRMVLSFPKNEYWTEMAPEGYDGRPPVPMEDNQKEERQKFLDDLETLGKDPKRAADSGDTPRYYGVYSILYNRRKALVPVKWGEVNDTLLYRRKLPGDVAFISGASQMQPEKKDREGAQDQETLSLFFLPSGLAMQASIHLGLLKDKRLDEGGPKFTIVVDPLSGRSEILEGFQDVDFVKTTK